MPKYLYYDDGCPHCGELVRIQARAERATIPGYCEWCEADLMFIVTPSSDWFEVRVEVLDLAPEDWANMSTR